MNRKYLLPFLVLPLILTGCTTGNQKQTFGQIIGGVAGGAAGSQIGGGSGRIVAGIAGALVGSMIGGYIGSELDEKDRMIADRTAQQTLERAPDGTSNRWANPNTGNSGSYVVTGTSNQGRQPCRDYTTTIRLADGTTKKAWGKACRQTDGSWQIASENPA